MKPHIRIIIVAGALLWLPLIPIKSISPALLAAVNEVRIAEKIIPPYSLGEKTDIEGTWELLNGSGSQAGYAIETKVLAPLPGFSGNPINMLVLVDLDGVFIDVLLLENNEPIFVSGLGEKPLVDFLQQYRGHSITSSMVVSTKYGKSNSSSSLVYLDGVTKATASVRIAHESIIASVRAVAKEKLKGLVNTHVSVTPKLTYDEPLTWDDLVEQGIAKHLQVTNAEMNERFKGTLWESDDAYATEYPDEHYLDVWVVDLGPPSIAKAIFQENTLAELARLRKVAPFDEPIFLIESARHGLISDDFVRNTSPDWITLSQDDLPISLRDADLVINTLPDVPQGKMLILRADRRLGFNPTQEWQINLLATRQHGSFQPQVGNVTLSVKNTSDQRFFDIVNQEAPQSPWIEAIDNRIGDIVVLLIVLLLGIGAMVNLRRLSQSRYLAYFRMGYLMVTLVFIGWWGQGQLSIVTPLATLIAVFQDKPLTFLLYDPFSLVIWIVVILSFWFWGRALFCGWLCPFGAFQEIIGKLAQALRIQPKSLPQKWHKSLRTLKYWVLLGLVLSALFTPEYMDKAVEVEPFKTAISVLFDRNVYFVGYAVLCLLASIWVYKAFCLYLCPLGALMSIGGWLRQKNFIDRRIDCGQPCQFCRVKCQYGAIQKTGEVRYSECFGCLDCVKIYHDARQCVPLVLQSKIERKA